MARISPASRMTVWPRLWVPGGKSLGKGGAVPKSYDLFQVHEHRWASRCHVVPSPINCGTSLERRGKVHHSAHKVTGSSFAIRAKALEPTIVSVETVKHGRQVCRLCEHIYLDWNVVFAFTSLGTWTTFQTSLSLTFISRKKENEGFKPYMDCCKG